MSRNYCASASDVLSETDEDTTRYSESLISSEQQKTVFTSYGFLSKVRYDHKSKNCKIQSVTYNSKTREYIIVDSRGILGWKSDFESSKASTLLEFPAHSFNAIKILLYCRSLNLYFALTKEYILKIYNLNFHETLSIESDVNALIHMVFNTVTGELITASRSEIYVWEFGQLNKKGDLTAATTGLLLKLKWGIEGGRLINRLTLDEDAQRLYCLSETNVWCYDLLGKLIFVVKKACSTHLSACAYGSNTVIAGAIDGQVSLSTTTGGNIHSFLSHSNLITEVIIHPCDAHLILTASLDGYVKLFSMDLLEELYSVKVFVGGIEHMALKSSNILYCVSTKEIEEFDLNYFCQFWGQLRYSAQSIELVKNGEKSNRVIVVDSNNTIKLFSVSERKKICTVLPPPIVDLSDTTLQCVHDRDYNLVYILVNTSEIWVYTTKTDPACFLANINLWNNKKSWINPRDMTSSISDPLMGFQSVNPKCHCIAVMQDFFKVEFMDEGGVLHSKCNLLACGMESGQIILYNPIMKGRKENTLQICKDPIVGLKYCRELLSCLATTKTTVGLLIKVINSNLEVTVSISCDDDIVCSAIKGATLAVGFASGHIIMKSQLLQHQKTIKLCKQSLADHYLGVISISFHPTLDIFCSSGKDFCIKIWNLDKRLLREITLDSSLTSACFFNDTDDILAGFKGHIFVIKNSGEYKYPEDNIDDFERPASQVYESPNIKYESRRPQTPELETLDKYLVPYSDMIFMTIGTWVVKDGGSSFIKNEQNDAHLSDFDSDDESLAPSDVYQSSLFSFSSSGTTHWRLPDCGVSPESSVADEVENEEATCFVEKETDNKGNMSVKDSEDVDTKVKMGGMLAKKQKHTVKKPMKVPKFAHGASERLKNAKIDAKKFKITRNSSRGKEGGKGSTELASAQLLSQSNEQTDVLPKQEQRRIVKKSRKSVSERKRVAAKTRMTNTTLPSHESQVGMTLQKDATVLSIDDGHSIDHVQALDGVPKREVSEHDGSLTNGDSLEQAIDEPEKEDQDNLKHIDTQLSIHVDKIEQSLDDITADNDQSPISSAHLGLNISGASSQYSDTDYAMETDTEIIDKDSVVDGEITKYDINDAKSVSVEDSAGLRYTEDMSLQPTVRIKERRALQRTKYKTTTKVVPAYSKTPTRSSRRGKSDTEEEYVQAALVDLAVKSEKIKFHDTRVSSSKRNQYQSKNESSAETRLRRHAQALHITFGEIVDNERVLSSTSMTLVKNRTSVDSDFNDLHKQEEAQDNLLKLCVSAFKKRAKKQKTVAPRLLSADSFEMNGKNKPSKLRTEVTGEELRPQTAPLPPSTRVEDNPMGIPSNVVRSARSKEILENETGCSKSNNVSSENGENYGMIVNIKRRNSPDAKDNSEEINGDISNENEPEDHSNRAYDRTLHAPTFRPAFVEKENVWREEPVGTNGGTGYSAIKKVRETATTRVDSYTQKDSEIRTQSQGNQATISRQESLHTPPSKQHYVEEVVDSSWQIMRKNANASPFRQREASERGLSPESSFTRIIPKGKVLFVDIPGRKQDKEENSRVYDLEWLSSQNEALQEKAKFEKHGNIARVMSPQEKLLKHRAASADMRRRQEDARFRRKLIEEQRLARADIRCISPAYTKEHLLKFLPEPEDAMGPRAIYEYNRPTPLNPDGKLAKSGELKGTRQDKNLLARLSGQAFRYGKMITKGENEEVLLEFIRSAASKKPGDVVLLPQPKSRPSIPAKCRNYVLVKERRKEGRQLSPLENEALKSRFRSLSST